MISRRPRPLPWAYLSLLLLACAQEPPPEIDQAGQAQVIRDLDAALSAAGQAQDVATFGSFFAEDAVQMPPNVPPLEGRAAIEESAADMFASGAVVRFETLDVQVSSSGDMAYSRGKYYLTIQIPEGLVRDEGSYLEVWQKVGGAWKITTDSFNSDLPAG